ncbi:hypothetical protein Q5P01_009010 [Channa striata]|uniref:BTB domain-containing protein n=1 Tax=Channa striata TaxID=64152 RepID=A0AA88N4L7_CHASR|nr:hypothetical protein Q5P01_009010 [Channa striata]
MTRTEDQEDRAEGGGPSVIELDPEVVTPEAFATLLDMIYTSTLSLGASNVMDVLLAASHLHLNTVVKACKLHLSKKNFPASPPKGWRSVQQQEHGPPLSVEKSASLQQVTSAMEEDMEEEGLGVDMIQLGGVEKQGLRRGLSGQESATPPSKHKRKTQEDGLGGGKRSCNLHGENYKECSPTVTRSTICTEEGGGELLSPDCLKTSDSLWEHQGNEEEDVDVEEKYEATKGESEEIQVPSQSDSSTGGVGAWEKDGDIDGDTVVKVKVGEEGEEVGEEPKMALIEVKKENLSSYSPDTAPNNSYPSPPPQYSKENANAHVNENKMTTDSPTHGDMNSIQSQLCTALHTDAQREAAHLGEESVDGDGLDSLSELAFSCFLNPSSESVMGSLEEEDSLTCLTAAATAAAAAASDAGEQCPNSEDANVSSALSSDSSSSVVFPVTSVPLQQLLPTQGPGFSDTLILQPTQNSLAGFLSGIRPGLSLEASVVQPSRAGKSSGATTFRRIAPKVPPGSEASSDPSSSSGAADRLPLTRASDDVLSKCKKAAAEDHVLLVEGEKKYACKICCKTFMNLTDF